MYKEKNNFYFSYKRLIFVFCFFYFFSANSQEPFLRKTSFLEGLPSDVVYDMYVSKEGLLYLGTDKGLVSYDGVHFTLFPFDKNLSSSVNSIQENEKGIIYCKNFSNQIYYLQNEQLHLDQDFNSLITKNKLSVVEFSVLGNEKILLTTNKLYSFKHHKPSLIYNSTSQIAKNYFFHITYNSTNKSFYISSLQSILVFKNRKLVEEKKTDISQKILEIHNGKVCFISKVDKNKIDVSGKDINLKNLGSTTLNKLISFGSELWVCSNDGIFEIDTSANLARNRFLKGKRISDIVKDKEGNHWISTLDNGLFLMPDKNFRSLNFLQSEEQKKPNFSRLKIAKNGHFFVATSTGSVYELDKNGNQLLKYQSENNHEIEFITLYKDFILTSACIFRVGNPVPISDIKMYFGKDIVVDHLGNYVNASPFYAGLMASDLNSNLIVPNNFEHFRKIKLGKNTSFLSFRDHRARAVFFDTNTHFYYVAYADDLYCYDSKGKVRIIKFPDNEPIIASEINQDTHGNLWIATLQKGVIQLQNNKVITHLTTKNKLSSNNCRRIEIDKDKLWILNDKGIETYNYRTKEVKNASANLCMKGITVNDFVVNDNTVTFVTNEGVFYANKNIVDQSPTPRFSVTNIWINHKKVPVRNDMVLDYDNNTLQIDFKTIFFKSLGDYSYEYRIKNNSENWNSLPSQATNVKFESLKYGNYIFQIRLKYGNKTSEIKELRFEINKPFWLQWWFTALEILALGIVIYKVNKRAVLRTKKKQEIKEQLALSQITALRSQMNPHFMFNVLNAVQGLIYSNQKSKASDYLGKFSDLMRKILEASDKKEIAIDKEIAMLKMYLELEKSRFENDFEYQFSLPSELDLSQYKIPSMIIQPFVENAIKHGLMHKKGVKVLKINAEIIDNYWHFTIEDNGIGRAKSAEINMNIKKHSSFATTAIDDRIGLINKISSSKIEINTEDKISNSNESLGTKITIMIPVKTI